MEQKTFTQRNAEINAKLAAAKTEIQRSWAGFVAITMICAAMAGVFVMAAQRAEQHYAMQDRENQERDVRW